MSEFQPGQRVRVLEEGGDPKEGGDPSVHPDRKLLGKEGTIQCGTGDLHRGPPTFYFVEFDSAPFLDKVMAYACEEYECRKSLTLTNST